MVVIILLSLSGDYEIYSDEDGDPILQDPKSLGDLQEIDLLTADVSEKSLAVGSQSSPLQDSVITCLPLFVLYLVILKTHVKEPILWYFLS